MLLKNYETSKCEGGVSV